MNTDWLAFPAAAVEEMFRYGDVFIFDSLAHGVWPLDEPVVRQRAWPGTTTAP